MDKYEIYSDISKRTDGGIYVGVVGPVRTGKSSFITRFMETLVLPNMSSKHKKDVATDEMPQSAGGKTIMTTQPKFVPAEAVAIILKDKAQVNVRLIDCVGYMVEGALGHEEGAKPRQVKTPWSDKPMPFEKAAEIGTRKVIEEHSTIGILVTSDGSITEIPRANYVKAEERVVKELKAINKPFVIVLNSKTPESEDAKRTRDNLEEKYSIPVILLNVLAMTMGDITDILEKILLEFPMKGFEIKLPKWISALPYESRLITEITDKVKAVTGVSKMRDYKLLEKALSEIPPLNAPDSFNVKLGEGSVSFEMSAKEGLFYKVLSEECGEEIKDEFNLISYVKSLSEARKEYVKLKDALKDVEEKGYGVVNPLLDEMKLEEPEIIKHGGRFGIKLKASAPSLHIMRVDVKTEVNPFVGTEQQSEDLIKYLLSEFENNPKGLWETNMFGKPLNSLVKEGLTNKIAYMKPETQAKMRKAISRIVNEGKGGVICILL